MTDIQTLKAERIEKGWGYEMILVNNDKYCGKILHMNKNERTSMHFHMSKMETWYVLSGKFIVRTIHPQTTDRQERLLSPGDIIHITQGCVHRLRALETGELFEISTHDDEKDSYRVSPGSTQKVNRHKTVTPIIEGDIELRCWTPDMSQTKATVSKFVQF